MKIMLLSATALALILSGPAFAAPHDHGDHHDNAPAAAHDTTPPPGGGAMHAAPDRAHHDHPGRGDTNHGSSGTPPAGSNAVAGPNPFTGGGTHHGHGNNTGVDTTHRSGHDNNRGTAFNPAANGRTHAGRGHNSAFDALRRAFNAPHHYRYRGSYHQPNGWYAHRWSFGEFLPALFYSRSYWISDYGYYDLTEPPPGTTWVRYGDDALLIDEDSGEVIQVVYGIFY